MAAVLDFNGSGRLEKKMKFVLREGVPAKNNERGWGGGSEYYVFSPPPLTVDSDTEVNMAGSITIARFKR